MKPIVIDYYSDLLCIWAYIGHARTCELQAQYPNQLEWRWHYLPVFGDVPGKFDTQWAERGGAKGYAAHVKEVVAEFSHVSLNSKCWDTVCPASSAPAHLWLAAARLAEQSGELPEGSEEALAWGYRVAFFEQAENIAHTDVLRNITMDLKVDAQAMTSRIQDGSAYSVLCQDLLKARDANVRVSPTYVFNSDRQRLTGNVGYRIIEANVKELLDQPHKQQSWC